MQITHFHFVKVSMSYINIFNKKIRISSFPSILSISLKSVGLKLIHLKKQTPYQKANVAADRVIMLYTNGPAIASASLCTGASCP